MRQCGQPRKRRSHIGRTALGSARRFNGLAVAMIVSTCIAGCARVHFGTRDLEADTNPGAKAPDYGEVAPLRPIGGSAVFGKIRVVDRGDGAGLLVSMMNVPPGAYRIAFHATPNCSSPNGFSAGPAWAPAGKDPATLVPVQYVNSEDRVELSLRVPELHAAGVNGVAGHSVVVYAGSQVTQARPGVPNERMACGVFEPAHRLQF